MKSNLDFQGDIDYAYGLRRPHWHRRLSLQTLERFLLSGEDVVGRNARVLRVQKFDTVELNNSFYRLPTAEAFRAS